MSTVYGLPLTTEFFFTGSMQTYVVPADVATVVVDAKGAQGGSAGYQGGKGGHITATIPVYQGQVLYVYVGGMGRSGSSVNGNGFNGGGSAASTWGYNWGGGGGASDVRTSPYDLQSRFVVAGGGGGAGGYGGGGAGGGVVGGSGSGWCGITSLGGSYFKGGDGSGGGQAGGLGFGGGAIYDGGGGGGGYYGVRNLCVLPYFLPFISVSLCLYLWIAFCPILHGVRVAQVGGAATQALAGRAFQWAISP